MIPIFHVSYCLLGGPHFRVVSHDCSQYHIQQWLANHGYIVISMDGRGTPYRGREWERAIYHNLIQIPLQDQCEGLQVIWEWCCEMFWM